MTNPAATLRVRISADLADIKSGLAVLRGELTKVKRESDRARPDMDSWSKGLAKVRTQLAGLGIGVGIGLLLREMVKSTAEADAAVAQLDARLKSTQGAAGLARGELIEMANALQKVTTFSDEAVINAEALLLSFTRVGREVFPRALKSALDLSVGLGQDLQTSIVTLGKALNDPIKGITSLSRAGVQFTASQKEMIKSLVASGETVKAQTLILAELETQFGGSAKAARETFGGAIEGAKNALGELLEGDSGSDGLRGAVTAVNNLTATLSDPEVKSGFNNLVSGIVSVTASMAESIAMTVNYIARLKETYSLNQRVQAGQKLTSYGDTNARIGQIGERQRQLRSAASQGASDRATFGTEDKGYLAFRIQNKEAYSRNQELAYLLRERTAMVRANTAAINAESAGEAEKAKAAKTASDAAKDAAEAADDVAKPKGGSRDNAAADKLKMIREEAEKLRKESEDAAAALAKELMARDERIDSGLQDARIATLNATGRTAEAAFLQIDDKWAKLLADLKATGKTAGIALVESVINLEKLDAQLAEWQARAGKISGGLAGKESTISAQVDAGLLGSVEGERQLQAAREEALQGMAALRQSTYDSLMLMDPASPEASNALSFLDQLDGNIANVVASMDTLRNSVKDAAVDALTTLFMDLVSGSKSAGEALKDFARGFVLAMAQIAARALATMVILRLMDTFWPGSSQLLIASANARVLHSGGIAGSGGRMRSGLSPLLFGAAPRYHSGGIAGKEPNEVYAVLERGEEVLAKNDPRHRYNGGMSGDRTIVKTPVVAIGDQAIADALAGAAGEHVILTHVRRNWGGLTRGNN